MLSPRRVAVVDPGTDTVAALSQLVNNIVVVNSGSLAKGNSAGTYAKVTVFPMPRSRLDAGTFRETSVVCT